MSGDACRNFRQPTQRCSIFIKRETERKQLKFTFEKAETTTCKKLQFISNKLIF